MNRAALAAAINQVARLTGSFRLRSGATSSEYFDKYRFESDPELLTAVAEQMVELIPPGVDGLAGLELGGVPVATALSLRTGVPAVFVRKKAKDYGTCQLAEGMNIDGTILCVVEDVVTSGGQIVQSCTDLRERGATVTHALCVIDRESGGAEKLASIDVELRSLFRRTDLDKAAST